MIDKEKIFRDPIYGYISIPDKFCKDFIDTAIFQRLRRIEQTSMRVLYPTAHHDRFAHSLGVYHLGKIAFANLKKNSENFLIEFITAEKWAFYQNTFELACLLHDCGHSPFSHTFEHYYLFGNEEKIKNRLASFYKTDLFFIEDYTSASAAEHEKISALILLSQFSEKIKENNACPLLAARMIMGCAYQTSTKLQSKFENKLISLLNGAGIDVDSLDYIQRDSWASGVSNVNIDHHRLLSSIMIKPDKDGIPQIVFKKHVLSVIENINIGRNFLYKWIYSHHKVTYEQNLITGIVEKINKEVTGNFCKKIFSVEAFTDVQKFKAFRYYLPTDDDVIYTIKQFRDIDPKIDEFLSRNYKLKALWKTYFEFNELYFKNVSGKNRMQIVAKIKQGALSEFFDPSEILCLKAKPKLKGINKNDFFIDIDGELIDASKATSQETENIDYFLIYVSNELILKKDEVLRRILSLQS